MLMQALSTVFLRIQEQVTASNVVVDSNGKVVKGTKILKDGEGNWIIVSNSKFVARVSDSDRPRKKNGRFYHYDQVLTDMTDGERKSHMPQTD